jgi:hypothetical protein
LWDHFSNYSMGGLYDMEGTLSGREFTVRLRPTSAVGRCANQVTVAYQIHMVLEGRFSEDDRLLTARFREVHTAGGEERVHLEWNWTAVRLELP